MSIDSQVKEASICNTLTFGFRFTPPTETFAQSYISWLNFLSTPNQSILVINSTDNITYRDGVLYISYFLMAHLQNQTLLFDFDFTSLENSSTMFTNSSATTLAFTVSTTP